VIVRISTEGQYELDESDVPTLNELDSAAVVACEAGDEEAFNTTFAKLLDLVRSEGTLVGDDHLGGSDAILPPPDSSMAEAKSGFNGEGLIPG
jgi:hypothetical protein